jgi:hypothetical protein
MCMKAHCAPNETMNELRLWVTLTRHTFLLWRTGLLRFRLETFGAYYPSPPYTVPAWRMSPRQSLLLLQRARMYARWLVEMEDLRRSGGHSWWDKRDVAWEDVTRD